MYGCSAVKIQIHPGCIAYSSLLRDGGENRTLKRPLKYWPENLSDHNQFCSTPKPELRGGKKLKLNKNYLENFVLFRREAGNGQEKSANRDSYFNPVMRYLFVF